jgi:arginyl-tRNA synthetase
MDQSRSHFEALYHRMGIRLTRADERGESFYNPLLGDVVKELTERGIAVESEGAKVIWVKGYDAPLIVQKTGGGFGYATTDLAALRFRVRDLKATRVIVVTDARQSQHFRMFLDAAKRAGWLEAVEFDHIMFGMILGEDGTPLKTRSGESVKLVDVLNEAESRAMKLVEERGNDLSADEKRKIASAVGIGAIKYFDLNRDPIGNYVFDWEKMLAMDGNTAPYLQYAYARIRSIFRKAGQDAPANPTLVLNHPAEVALVKHILRLGEVANIIARELKPHHLCGYLYELSTKFSGFYENCPVLQSEEPTRSSRLALCEMTARTLALGLDLLGIEHPERM